MAPEAAGFVTSGHQAAFRRSFRSMVGGIIRSNVTLGISAVHPQALPDILLIRKHQ